MTASPTPSSAPASPAASTVGPRRVRIFISSPADAQFERMRVDRVVERLNGAFADLARLETVRWEREFYKAHETFQSQIPEAADCDIVIAVLRHRLGTELPADFQRMPDGEPYPSGTAYEILTAMEAAGHKGLPDIYVFRFPEPPVVKLDDAETNALITEQWNRLKGFFARWFRTPEGHFKASYHEFRSTDEFEQQVESLLRKWLEEKVLKGRAVVWPIETKGSPFRGLSSFGARHAAVFFGRGRDIARSVDLLKEGSARGTAFLLLVGASGSGKSSLARAGIVPRLTTPGVVPGVDLWRVALYRPGEVRGDPAAGLAARLFEGTGAAGEDDAGRPAALPELATGDYSTAEALAVLMGHGDETATKPVLAALDKIAAAEQRSSGHARALRADLVLVVDQIDNLFTAGVTPEQRQRFAALLAAFAATGRVWIVATLRADLYERFLKEPKLFELKTAGATYDLQPPGPAELAEIVRGPAAAADLDFDADPATGRTLDEALLADADRPDMLPLLQFTLDQLFERRETSDGRARLTFAAYAAIGGMGGAIDRQAEVAVTALGPDEQSRLPRLLRQLAEPDRDGATAGPLTIRAVPLAEAAFDEPSARLVDALVEARVLLSSTEGGATHVRLAHQRVLESWARARGIVAENASFFRIRGDIEDQRRRWEESGRRADLLVPAGLPLAEAESVARKFGPELPAGTVGFVAASTRKARTRIRLLIAATAVFAVIAVVAVWQTFAAEARREEAADARDRAEQNFAAARGAINGLTTNIVQGLRNAGSIQIAVIHQILNELQTTVDALVATDADDLELRNLRVRMLSEFALTYQTQGDIAAAIGAANETVAGARSLALADPANLRYPENLSIALTRQGTIYLSAGDLANAAPAAIEAADLARELVAFDEANDGYRADLLSALLLLGDVRSQAGDFGGAGAALDEALEIGRVLVAAHPDDVVQQRSFSVALNKAGDLRRDSGDTAGAVTLYEEGLSIARALSAIDPDNALWLADLSTHLDNLSSIQMMTGEFAAALVAQEESVAIQRRLAASDPGNTEYRRNLSVALLSIGDNYVLQEDYSSARPLYEEALAISRDLAALDPTNRERQRDLSISLDRLGNALNGTRDPAAAPIYEEGLVISKTLALADPANQLWQNDYLIGIVKVAVTADDARRAEVIDEGFALLARLEAAGLATDENRGWGDVLGQIREIFAPDPVPAGPAAAVPPAATP